MSSSRPIPWPADPHTKAKHAVYRQYLSKWTPIMVKGWDANITYAEGFAGPGVYTDGSAGSPVIALRSVLDRPELKSLVNEHRMRFVFVDHERRCIDRLRSELHDATNGIDADGLRAHGLDVSLRQDSCEPGLVDELTQVNAWGRPMLVVLDTWGGGVSHDLIRRVADNPSSEVIVTFQPQYFARFAGVNDMPHGDRVYGNDSWRAVSELKPAAKERWLLSRYRDTIRDAGFPYVLDFELIDVRGQALYLVFGTTNDLGLKKMKEAMWEVDDIGGIGYRDPRDPNQQTLEVQIEPQTGALRRLIVQHLQQHPSGQTIRELREFALFRTVFKESQVKPVIRSLLELGHLEHPRADLESLNMNSTVTIAEQDGRGTA